MYMLHKMSEVRGWSHKEMMEMPKEIFYRYYGYWYSDQFNEMLKQKYEEEKQKREEARKQAQEQPRQWKSFK